MQTFKYSPEHSQSFWDHLCLIDQPDVNLHTLQLSPKQHLTSEQIEMIRRDFSIALHSKSYHCSTYHKILLEFGLVYLNKDATPLEMISLLTSILRRLKSNHCGLLLSSICYNNRAAQYDKMEHREQAILNYTKAIQIHSHYSIFYNNRGKTLDEMGRENEALLDYSKSIELNPSFIDPYFARGAIYYKRNDYENSVEDFNRIIEMDPTNTTAYFHRSCVHQAMNKPIHQLRDLILGKLQTIHQQSSTNITTTTSSNSNTTTTDHLNSGVNDTSYRDMNYERYNHIRLGLLESLLVKSSDPLFSE